VISGVVINESDPKVELIEGVIGNFMNVRVGNLQGVIGVSRAAWEGVCAHLSSMAWLTDWIWRSFDIQSYASDNIGINQRFHISEVVMSESVMPEGQVECHCRCWVSELYNGLSHTVQERSIVVIDGGNEE
jgi:hypothetical protein